MTCDERRKGLIDLSRIPLPGDPLHYSGQSDPYFRRAWEGPRFPWPLLGEHEAPTNEATTQPKASEPLTLESLQKAMDSLPKPGAAMIAVNRLANGLGELRHHPQDREWAEKVAKGLVDALGPPTLLNRNRGIVLVEFALMPLGRLWLHIEGGSEVWISDGCSVWMNVALSGTPDIEVTGPGSFGRLPTEAIEGESDAPVSEG